MSDSNTAVDPRYLAYLQERTRGDDAFLGELKAAARAAGIPPIWISPEQAGLMEILLAGAGAQRVLEVGTLAGYAAIRMARALPAGGRLVTLELDPERAAFARRWAGDPRSGVAGRVEVLEGAALDLMRTLPDDHFDAAFLDADKANYTRYLAEARRVVRSRGWILVDNAFAFGQLFHERPTDPEAEAVRAFNDHLASLAELHAVIVPVGDGLWIALNP